MGTGAWRSASRQSWGDRRTLAPRGPLSVWGSRPSTRSPRKAHGLLGPPAKSPRTSTFRAHGETLECPARGGSSSHLKTSRAHGASRRLVGLDEGSARGCAGFRRPGDGDAAGEGSIRLTVSVAFPLQVFGLRHPVSKGDGEGVESWLSSAWSIVSARCPWGPVT